MTDDMDTASAVFRSRVKKLREERGLSQTELGLRLAEFGESLGQSRIAAIEATGSVTIDQATAFASVLDVPIEVLLYARPSSIGGAVQQHQLTRILSAADTLRAEVRSMIEATGPVDGRMKSLKGRHR